MDELAQFWRDSTSLLTLSAVLVAGGIGFIFGVFAAQFDAVPTRARCVLTALLASFGTAYFVSLTLSRVFDSDYPGTNPTASLGNMLLWWVACLTVLLGDDAARRLEHWWTRRRRRP